MIEKDISKRPVLSISLLCAGKKPEEAKKCLDSLLTIKERINTEIIIVDTGCDASMKETISSYADRVIPFKWCDDFAKARNAGLKECSGEWFLYVDDDEWFDNTDSIVNFFSSGEYKNYDAAKYVIRNYRNAEGTDYDDFWATRLIRRSEDLKFKGKIHEYPSPLTGKSKMLDCFAHHYGYVYKNSQDHYAKAIRNIKPIMDMIKEDPSNLHWYIQLEQELIAIKDIGRLHDLCDDMISKLDKADDNDHELNLCRADFYYGKLWSDIQTFQYDSAINEFNVFRKDRRNTPECLAALESQVIIAFFEKKDYHKTVSYSKKFVGEYEKTVSLDNREEILTDNLGLNTRDIFATRNVIYVYSMLIASGIRLSDSDIITSYFDSLARLKDDGSQFDIIYKDMTDAFADLPYDDRFVKYADTMLSYNTTAEEISHIAVKIEDKSKNDNNGRFANLIRVLGQTKNGSNYYLHYIRMRYEAEYGDDRRKLLELYESLILLTNDFFNLDESVWQIADEKDIDLGRIFKEIPFFKWQKAVDTYMEKHGGDDSRAVRRMMSRFDSDDDIRFRYFRLKALETDIINADASDAAKKLADYSGQCEAYYRKLYRSAQFEIDAESSVLPPQCQFAVCFNAALQTGRFDECSGVYPPFDEALDEYIRQAWESYQYRLRAENRKVLVYSADMDKKPDAVIEKIRSILFYFSHFSDSIMFIWHSKPFSDRWTDDQKHKYESMRDGFVKEDWGIYDTSEDTDSLFERADAFYGNDDAMLEYARSHEKAALREKTDEPVTGENVVFDQNMIPPSLPAHQTIIQESNPTDIAMFRQMLELGRLETASASE